MQAAAAAIPKLMQVLGKMGGTGAGAGEGGTLTKRLNDAGGTIYSVQAIAGAVKGLGSAFLGAINPLNVFQKGLSAVSGVATSVASVLSPLSYVNAAFETMTGLMASSVQHVTAFGRALKPFTDAANPAVGKFFEAAETDLVASFGRALLPAMGAATAVTRAFADVIFRLSGPTQQLMRAFFDPLAAMLPKIVTAMTPMLDNVGDFISLMAELAGPVMSGVASVVLEVANAFGYLDRKLREVLVYLGLATPRGGSAAGGSLGAGATNVKFGSVEDFFRDAMKAAFSLGSGSTVSEDTTLLRSIELSLNELPGQLAKEIAKLLPGSETAADAAETVDRIAEGARDLGEEVERRGTAAWDRVRSWF